MSVYVRSPHCPPGRRGPEIGRCRAGQGEGLECKVLSCFVMSGPVDGERRQGAVRRVRHYQNIYLSSARPSRPPGHRLSPGEVVAG